MAETQIEQESVSKSTFSLNESRQILSNPIDFSDKSVSHKRLQESRFAAFTDGSAISNAQNADAGWAVWFPTKKRLIAKEMIGTNNQAELEAIRYCLWYFIQNYMDEELPDNTFYIYSDSEYSINAVTGKNKAKANSEKIHVCKQLIKQIKTKHNISFIHVRAHTKKTDYLSINNAIVDEAARSCANRKRLA